MGYWVLTANGGVFTHGTVDFYGAATSKLPVTDAVDLVPTVDGAGYWMVTASGRVQAFGDAQVFGWEPESVLESPVKRLVPTPDGQGYWLVTADGGVFSFGDAKFFGSRWSPTAAGDVAAFTPTPDGGGYWITTAAGQVFAYGDARSFGDGVPAQLVTPVVAMAASADGLGYWLVTADGGVFSFGDAKFAGSDWTLHGTDRIAGITATPDGQGYWLVTTTGQVYAYGDAIALPNPTPDPLTAQAVAIAVPRVGAVADVPQQFVSVAQQAAATCSGLSWTVLAGIGKVESDFGRSTLPGVSSGTNYAGAAGPMQMGIDGAAGATFQAYDHPVAADMTPTPATGAVPSNPWDLTDALYAATRDLCANGAGNPATLDQAILAYNHSDSYLSAVRSLAALYAGQDTGSASVVKVATTQIGVPYLWGGTTPYVGLDCSGLVQWAYRAVGINLPRTSEEQWAALPHLDPGAPLQPGDLLFFGPADGPTHVGMYIGGGLMVDAPHTGAFVRVEPYQWSDFLGAARPAPAAAPTPAPSA